jgi:hypothetical protein
MLMRRRHAQSFGWKRLRLLSLLEIRKPPSSPQSTEARVKGKLNAMRSGAGENVAGMMMAARKGKKLSEKDEEGTLDDLAQLEALENEGNKEE